MNQTITLALLFLGILIIGVYVRNSRKLDKLRISPAEAKKRLNLDKDIILLDVRTREEYLKEHIPESAWIPAKVLAREASRKLPDKQATIFVYCSSGRRCRVAARRLLKQGYTNVFDLGGLTHWPYRTISGRKK